MGDAAGSCGFKTADLVKEKLVSSDDIGIARRVRNVFQDMRPGAASSKPQISLKKLGIEQGEKKCASGDAAESCGFKTADLVEEKLVSSADIGMARVSKKCFLVVAAGSCGFKTTDLVEEKLGGGGSTAERHVSTSFV